ncbi:A/G-specific adenine glycosylase [Candidatus Parabeggiatoa sp. HSG14]|uniref:A/G-specific adenine glycosylase n=1 Tax=Candidatus Parabeggiatoa sp. HSG14 TaxID=3055593 RepID=UPI0025A80A9C|nr:A/G-specific adenine glycosylase [Thiotrichales bacterium HSG14]
MPINSFSQRLLTWFDKYGRTDLPWQKKITSYRVWVSEIMLQQTQVNTVIPYYQRFMERFTDVQTLADASLDEVLHYWTGLGYYARARHLHKASQQICTEHEGKLPIDLEKLMRLPGIGRSTGGAILALAHKQRYPILDGNVKRVLCRYYAIDGWAGKTKIANNLWHLAEKNTPKKRVAAYTQAIMDLGATVCTRTKPHCQFCPFSDDCIAHQNHCETVYPTPKPRKTLPIKTITFIMLQNSLGEVLLEKRPSKGIWGGLWSFPECLRIDDIPAWCQQNLNNTTLKCYTWQPLRHTFTHFHLEITPVLIPIETEISQTVILKNIVWYNPTQPQLYGLAAPVVRLLKQLTVSKGELLL